MTFLPYIAAILLLTVAQASHPPYHPAPYPSPYPPKYPYSSYPAPRPSYKPSYKPQYPPKTEQPPICSLDITEMYCVEDPEYPEKDIVYALKQHKHVVLDLYADIAGLDTKASVDELTKLEEEVSLCPSDVAYILPLRAVNTAGQWKIIVNNIHTDYEEYTQSARVETCLTPGTPCPLVPDCNESACLQKSVYHRFLTYVPEDYQYPFAIDSFKLPSSCSCHVSKFELLH